MGLKLKNLLHICCFTFFILAGCAPAIVKQVGLDNHALQTRLPVASLLQAETGDEWVLTPGPLWLASLRPQQELTFLGIKGAADHAYGVLFEIDLDNDRLRYLPLPTGESPLSILTQPERLAVLEKQVMDWPEAKNRFTDLPVRDISLLQVKERLTSPIPEPKQIFAVAANYPSHLFIDLSLPDKPGLIARLKKARPRLFRKYPPVAAPGDSTSGQEDYTDLPGPFGSIMIPAQVQIPALEGQNQGVPGHLDYEVEIAVVIGRDLSWDVAKTMNDTELRQVVAGYLLFSDAKVRDPQAMGKILQVFRDQKSVPGNPYRVGEEALDGTLGIWNETTCHWWSYAASWGHYTTYGPLLVAASNRTAFPPRMIVSARSYSSSAERPVRPPQDVPLDQLLLRQATVTTLEEGYSDALIWDIPAIIRSLLDPADNALAFAGEVPVLLAGDLIALGTPGGTVISAKPWWLLPMAEDLLFWKGPEGFYDMFFAPTEGYYLHPGDELFLWGEGLGYQLLRVDEAVSE